MPQDWILASDIGTSSVKTALFQSDGTLVDSSSHSHGTRQLQPGWADQDAMAWWIGFCRNVRDLVSRHPDARHRIAGIGVSGQMLGCLALSSSGAPLYPSLIHADTRSDRETRHIRDAVGAENLYNRTGNILDARSGLSKILWLKGNEPEVYRKAARFMQAKDFIVSKLTGNLDSTDWSDAGHTQWMDVNNRTYLTDVFSELGLESGKLPTLHNGTDIVGNLTHDAARELDLIPGIPVVAGAGDGSCASAGAGSSLAGDFYACLGTTAWISYTATKPCFDPKQRLFNLISADGRTCGVYGTTQSAGRSVTWVMDLLGETDLKEFDRKASQVRAGSEGLIFLPYLEGERTPVYDSDARGVFFGICDAHQRAHFERAVLEGVALALRDIVTVFRESMTLSAMRLIGGGAGSDLWRAIIASACGLTIERLKTPTGDATSLGMALATSVGVGMHPDLASAQREISVLDVQVPVPLDAAAYDRIYPIYSELYGVNKKMFARLAELRS